MAQLKVGQDSGPTEIFEIYRMFFPLNLSILKLAKSKTKGDKYYWRAQTILLQSHHFDFDQSLFESYKADFVECKDDWKDDYWVVIHLKLFFGVKPLGLTLELKDEFNVFQSEPTPVSLKSLFWFLRGANEKDPKTSIDFYKKSMEYDSKNTDAFLYYVRKCDRYKMLSIDILLHLMKVTYQELKHLVPAEFLNEMIGFCHRVGNNQKEINEYISYRDQNY